MEANQDRKPVKQVINQIPYDAADPLVEGFTFRVGLFIYRVYKEKSRRRKFVKAIGVIDA